MSGLSILPNGLVFEYIDQNEADFLFDEILIRNIYNITTSDPQSDVKKRRHNETGGSRYKKANIKNDTVVSLPINIQLSDGDTVIDVGANIGLFSLYCQLKSTNLLIYAIEPLPPIVEVLTRNMANFKTSKLGIKSQSSVHILPFGISNTTNALPSNCFDNDIADKTIGESLRADESEDTFYYFPSTPAESTRHLNEWKTQQGVLLDYVNPSQLTSSLQSSTTDNDYSFKTSYAKQSANQINDGKVTVTDKNSKVESASKMETYNCKLLSLSRIIEIYQIQSRIDLLKVDVEGDELNVLIGIGSDQNWDIIKQIVIGNSIYLHAVKVV